MDNEKNVKQKRNGFEQHISCSTLEMLSKTIEKLGNNVLRRLLVLLACLNYHKG